MTDAVPINSEPINSEPINSEPVKVDIVGVAESAPRADLTTAAGESAEDVRRLLEHWFPGRIGEPAGTLSLREALRPRPDTAYAGIFGSTFVLCGQELVELADLTALVDTAPEAGTLIRLQVDGVMDSVALDVIAPGGVLVRELLAIGDEGVVADEGSRLDAELPFWDDAATEDDLVPFDPIAFGDALLVDLFGVSRASSVGTADAGAQPLVGFVVLPDPELAEPATGPDEDAVADIAPASTASTARPLPGLSEPTERDPLGLGAGSEGRPVAPPSDDPEPPAQHRSWWQRLFSGG
jgi:Family of unknown function (DUF6928)